MSVTMRMEQLATSGIRRGLNGSFLMERPYCIQHYGEVHSACQPHPVRVRVGVPPLLLLPPERGRGGDVVRISNSLCYSYLGSTNF